MLDSDIDAAMAEHLKHTPRRVGGGGYKKLAINKTIKP